MELQYVKEDYKTNDYIAYLPMLVDRLFLMLK